MEAHVQVEPWLWPAFVGGVLFLLILDLGILQRRTHVIKPREALLMSGVWIAIALSFNAWFAWRYGAELGTQFLTGYLIEESLSVDNLFVMLLIFSALKIPQQYQHRVLFWGILGAIFTRGAMILGGVQLVRSFDWILYIFGGILVFTAAKFFWESDDDEEITDHWAVRTVRRIIPVTQDIQGQHFFVRQDRRLMATPLFVTLVVIEIMDVVFAVDSIPAVFSVTTHPFVAFASNILAVLGLRSMYFVIADWVGKLRYLKPGLSAILGFVGVKMLIADFYHIPTWVSLLVLAGILTTAGLTSWYVARVNPDSV